MDAVGLLEIVSDFAVGHAGAFVEIDDGSLGVGPDLALGGAGGVGGLQGMAAAHPSATAFAATLVDAELAPHRLRGQVRLELLVDAVILLEVAAAVGTGIG